MKLLKWFFLILFVAPNFSSGMGSIQSGGGNFSIASFMRMARESIEVIRGTAGAPILDANWFAGRLEAQLNLIDVQRSRTNLTFVVNGQEVTSPVKLSQFDRLSDAGRRALVLEVLAGNDPQLSLERAYFPKLAAWVSRRVTLVHNVERFCDGDERNDPRYRKLCQQLDQ